MSFIHILVCLWLICCKGEAAFPESEFDLSSPPLVACRCAHSYVNDSCQDEFQNWTIVNNGFMEAFGKKDFRIEIKDKLDGVCKDSKDVNRCKHILHLNNVVVIGTGKQTKLKEVLQSKTQTLFCPGSIEPKLEELTLSNIKQVHFSPESIAERSNSLKIHLNHIQDDISFPPGWYDYQYKVPDYEEDSEGSGMHNSTLKNPSLQISLFEVGNVILNSNCLRADSVAFDVSGAKHLLIDISAVSEENPLSSLISLRKVDSAEIRSSWGDFMLVEFVKVVNIYPGSISKTINYVIFKDILNLTSNHNLSDLIHIESISILNVTSWLLPDSTSSYDDANMAPEQISTQSHVGTRSPIPKLIDMQNTHMLLKGKNKIKLTAKKIAIRNSAFISTEPTNTSLLFIGHDFELENDVFPQWISFCQIKTPIVCQNFTPFRLVCPVGFPYHFNESIFEASKCKEIDPNHNSEVMKTVSHYFLGICILILVILIIIASALIYKHKRLSGKWRPRKLGSVNLPSSHQAISSKRSQILHIPSNDSQISFKFPRHFMGQVIPSYDDTIPAVNFYSYEDLSVLREQTQQNIERDLQKLTAVQLLNIRPCLEEPKDDSNEEEETVQEFRRSSLSSGTSKSSH